MTYHHGNLRKALIERAVEVIAKDGVGALSLRSLARDLGVSHAAPARHFKDKAAVLTAIATEGNRRIIAALNEAAEQAGDNPIVRYNAIGKALIHFALKNPAHYRVFIHPEVSRHADADLRAEYRTFMAALYEAAKQAQEAGWKRETPTMDLVMFSCAAAMGAAQLLTDPIERTFFGQIDPDHVADAVIDLTVPLPEDAAASQRGRSEK